MLKTIVAFSFRVSETNIACYTETIGAPTNVLLNILQLTLTQLAQYPTGNPEVPGLILTWGKIFAEIFLLSFRKPLIPLSSTLRN